MAREAGRDPDRIVRVYNVMGLITPESRAAGAGTRARIVSTVLSGAATLNLTGAFGPPGIRRSLVPQSLGPTLPVLYWLVGLRRGVAAVAPGLPRVLQAAGLHAGPAPGADGEARPSGTDGRTRADQGTGAASGVSHRPALATDGPPHEADQGISCSALPSRSG